MQVDKQYPMFVSTEEDKQVMEVYCKRELENWRETMEKFHAIDRKKCGGLTKRLKMRPTLEKSWNELRQAFLTVLIGFN